MRETLCVHSRGHSNCPFEQKIGHNLCLDEGSVDFFCRLLGRIKEIRCLYCRSYDLCSIDQFSRKLGDNSGLRAFAQLTQKLGQIHLVGKKTQVNDPGPSWPSCFTLVYNTYPHLLDKWNI